MERLRPYFPKSRGRARVDDRRVLSGIIFINRNGLRWCDGWLALAAKVRNPPFMSKCAWRSICYYRPFVSIDMNGPNLPFTSTSGCCSAARHCGHSCILQHFGWLIRRSADKTDFSRRFMNDLFLIRPILLASVCMVLATTSLAYLYPLSCVTLTIGWDNICLHSAQKIYAILTP
jgi:transposase